MSPTILNVRLKLAMFESRKKQKRIAKLARIAETQLSHIVRGRRTATPEERKRLAEVLGKPERELFIIPETSAILHRTTRQDGTETNKVDSERAS
jgi:transcriptional regulator with XRE-family HTH domain